MDVALLRHRHELTNVAIQDTQVGDMRRDDPVLDCVVTNSFADFLQHILMDHFL